MTARPVTIAAVATAVPGASWREREDRLRRLGLAVEVPNDGTWTDADLRDLRVDVATVQAFRMHEWHPLHPDPGARLKARAHILETIDLAVRLGAPRVLAVCGFGACGVDAPFERCRDFFASFLPAVRSAGLRLLIEPLSPRRCDTLTDPWEIRRLVESLKAPDALGLALDTGHLLDSGFHLDDLAARWEGPVEELQLKGPLSTPPPLDLPFGRLISRLTPRVVAIEHRETTTPEAFDALVEALRRAATP